MVRLVVSIEILDTVCIFDVATVNECALIVFICAKKSPAFDYVMIMISYTAIMIN